MAKERQDSVIQEDPEELHRMRLVAISTAGLLNTRESSRLRIDSDHVWWTPTYQDMCIVVDREIMEREYNKILYEKVKELENDNLRLQRELDAAGAMLGDRALRCKTREQEWPSEMPAIPEDSVLPQANAESSYLAGERRESLFPLDGKHLDVGGAEGRGLGQSIQQQDKPVFR